MKTKSKLSQAFHHFVNQQSAGGIILLLATAIALAFSNSSAQQIYLSFWNFICFGMTLHHWVNDGLMTLFFFVIGLEIKKEVRVGELSNKKAAALPAAAAIGGMIVPALIYSAINYGNSTIKGWGIPMATDIAFAVGVLSLLGNRIPISLKIFLTAFAIVDDLGAVLVIALFYTSEILWLYLLVGLSILASLFVLNKKGISNIFLFLGLGIFVWLTFLKSGVHATVAGVLLAMVIPDKLIIKIEHTLSQLVLFFIMPIFALSNAGISLSNTSISNPVSIGIIAGLVLGKQIGITFFAWIAVKLKIAELPSNIRWSQLYGIACLGGIGFTMSLFIATLSFGESEQLVFAKSGILIASIISGVIGIALLFLFRRTILLAPRTPVSRD